MTGAALRGPAAAAKPHRPYDWGGGRVPLIETSAPALAVREDLRNATDILAERVRLHPRHVAFQVRRGGGWRDVCGSWQAQKLPTPTLLFASSPKIL